MPEERGDRRRAHAVLGLAVRKIHQELIVVGGISEFVQEFRAALGRPFRNALPSILVKLLQRNRHFCQSMRSQPRATIGIFEELP